MSRKTIAWLLKGVIIGAGLMLAAAGFWLVPDFVKLVNSFAPGYEGLTSGTVVYINLAFLPVYVCLALAWQVFSTIGRDESFCEKNGRRLIWAARMALVDVAMVMLFMGYLLSCFSFLVSPFMLLCSIGLIFIGLSAAICCFALSKLVIQAATMKADADLTV